jgi:chromosome segregation ATPase
MHDVFRLNTSSVDDVVVPISARLDRLQVPRPDLAAALESVDNAARLLASTRANAQTSIREAHSAIARLSKDLNDREAELAGEAARSARMESQLEVCTREASESAQAAERRARILEDRIEELLARVQASQDQLEEQAAGFDSLSTDLYSQISAAERRATEAEQNLLRLATYITQRFGEHSAEARAA